jgi:hypothetical protein
LGKINAVGAAGLNVFGSVVVVLNSARLVREGEEFDPFEEDAEPGTKSQDSQTTSVEHDAGGLKVAMDDA